MLANDESYNMLLGDGQSNASHPLTSYLPPKEKDSHISIDDLSDIDITLMTLRKPTELKKVIDSVPKPSRAVPKNGLPYWFRMGLESKLPVPKMPVGKIIFSRGKIGEDVRRVGLGFDGPRPQFDLSDPYCYNVSYDYVPLHDPHLAPHFRQAPAKNRMTMLGFCTKDGRAVCSLKEFNQYRKYLYNRFMDRIHVEMAKLDERARDDLTLKKVDQDVARRQLHFARAEKAREQMEKYQKMFADEIAEKKRQAKEQENKIKARMKYLAQFNEKRRQERAAKAQEAEERIKQRVQAAAEMELRRKITMVRQWRQNEKRRINRVNAEKEAKTKRLQDEANRKWEQRVSGQNQKIQEERILLKLYTEDLAAGATRRRKRAEIYAYNTDLALQRIRLANWKELHGGSKKKQQLIKKMGIEFEKSKRGAKGMCPEFAQKIAAEAMSNAMSTAGDALTTLGQARARMDIETILPSPPVRLLEQLLETAVLEFARRRVHLLLRDVERAVRHKAEEVFFKTIRQSDAGRRRSKQPRWSVQLTTALAQQYATVRGQSIAFGNIAHIAPEESVDHDLKSTKDRPPTPVPSLTKLAEVTFTDRVEDLPDPVTVASALPERKKLLEMVNTAAKILSRNVSQRVQKGMDLTIGKVTLPHQRHPMEWGEAVEALSEAVVNSTVNIECPDIRRCTIFLTHRILRRLQIDMREEKIRRITKPDNNCGSIARNIFVNQSGWCDNACCLFLGNGVSLHPISETQSGVEDVPAGMRLHGARARLYTSVLAGARAGDQLDAGQTNEEFDTHVPDDIVLEDEVILHEELQIILPPRCDDVTAESSSTTTTTTTDNSSTS
ncbi:uncharacterized protein LOC113229918 [Hyposmocoma kahamanoa]|uniref:uncharacterized protein LOC113229918 n=1 Tax=Hyposmocoma kahamanoa TaxID=1477025 RepID=UPI000E6D67CF|nr:uncharacterized protein LOC113229918 [Hyposmocoma kahamanoa]